MRLRIKGSRSNCLHERRNRHTSALDTGFKSVSVKKATDIKTFSWLRFKDKFRQILFLYSRYLESEKKRSGIDISKIKHRRKDYKFDDFKCLITLYYISRTSSKRNTANSYNFYRRWSSKRNKSVNLLLI